MTEEQKAAYVNAQAVAARIELESMLAANSERRSSGYADAYDEKAFLSLIDKYDLHHNS